MTSIITALGEWLWPIVGAAFIALIGLLGAEQVRISNRDTTIAQKDALVSQKNGDIAKLQSDAASAAMVATKQLEQVKIDHDQQLAKANDDAAIKVSTATADAANAVIARDQLLARLRARLAAVPIASGGAASANFPATSFSAPTPAGSLYSELFGSAVGEAQRYAGIADAALIAGEQCEASYPVK